MVVPRETCVECLERGNHRSSESKTVLNMQESAEVIVSQNAGMQHNTGRSLREIPACPRLRKDVSTINKSDVYDNHTEGLKKEKGVSTFC